MASARVYAGLVPRRWWARRPHLPVPDRRWVAFRMETAYGDPGAVPSGADLVAFVAWSSDERARRRARHRAAGLHGSGEPVR